MQAHTPTKRALIVAIGDYNNAAPNLPAAPTEAKIWEKLLTSPLYGFEEPVCLIDGDADLESVTVALTALLSNRQTNDQVVFVFLGHGGLAKGLGGAPEDALVMYPTNSNLQEAALTVSHLKQIWETARPPEGVDITMILDCCFAARFNIDTNAKEMRKVAKELRTEATTPQFAAQFAGVTEEFHSATGRFQNLFELSSWVPTEEHLELPLLLAATRRRQSAFQIPSPEGKPRLLFSSTALKKLQKLSSQGQRESFARFVAGLTPLLKGVRQTPKLVGNKQRKHELMFGETGSSEGKTQTLADVDASPFAINVRIFGLCCVIPPVFDSPFEQRIVMPYDDIAKPGDSYHHFAFLEIPQDAIVRRKGLEPSKTYTRGGVDFARWDLDSHRIEFDNDDGGDFETTWRYKTHVPKMRALAPELDPFPRPECYDAIPDPLLFSLFVDLDTGTASTATLEVGETSYMRPQTYEVNWGPQRTPKSVNVMLPTTGPETLILVYGPQGPPAAEILVRSAASIMVGNAREKDITGDGSGSSMSEHFRIMYKLAPEEPVNAPLPFVAAVPIDSCSVHNWP